MIESYKDGYDKCIHKIPGNGSNNPPFPKDEEGMDFKELWASNNEEIAKLKKTIQTSICWLFENFFEDSVEKVDEDIQDCITNKSQRILLEENFDQIYAEGMQEFWEHESGTTTSTECGCRKNKGAV
jgi:hypothetical protein